MSGTGKHHAFIVEKFLKMGILTLPLYEVLKIIIS